MTQPQPLDLDQIDTVIAAATPGPWGVYEFGYMIEIAADLEETGHGYHARRVLARFDEEPLDNDPTHREWTAEEDWAQVQADAKFIAAMSPETAAAMAAEIRRLRDQLADVRTKTLTTEADEIVLHCPDHSPQDQDGVWMDCHCAVADDMRRRAAARP